MRVKPLFLDNGLICIVPSYSADRLRRWPQLSDAVLPCSLCLAYVPPLWNRLVLRHRFPGATIMLPFLTHRRLTILAIMVLAVPTVVALFPPAEVHGQGGAVVISQVYAGGQSGTAPIRSDYVELFNPGTDPVPVDGWSVQYASREGTTWRRAFLAGTIPPGGFYLVQGVTGEAGAELPTPDASGGLSLAVGNGRLALVRSTSALTCGADPGCA